MAMGAICQSLAHSRGILLENAVVAQQQGAVRSQAAKLLADAGANSS